MLSWIVTSCVLILAVLLIRRVFRGKASARAVYALWLFVALRLLIPGSVAVNAPVPAVAEVVNRSPVVQLSDKLDGADSLTLTPEGDVEAHYSAEGQTGGTTQIVAESAGQREFNFMNALVSLKKLVIPAWLCGAAAVALVFALSWMKFSRSVRRSRELIQVPGTPVRVYISDAVDTPCLFGLFSPAVYLPSYVASEGRLMRHALEHELSHYRQRDHIWCVLRCACLALHWYNPLVWLAVKLSKRDCELACDEATVGRLGEAERASYGRSLIRLTCETPRGAVVATAMCARPKELKERITMLTKNKHSIIALALAAVLAFTATACSFVSSATEPTGIPGSDAGNVALREGTESTYDFTAPGGAEGVRISAWVFDGTRWVEQPQTDVDCSAETGSLSFSIDTSHNLYGYVLEFTGRNTVSASGESLGTLAGDEDADFRGRHINAGPIECAVNETVPLVMATTASGASTDYFTGPTEIEDKDAEYVCFTITFTAGEGSILLSGQDESVDPPYQAVYDFTAPEGAGRIQVNFYRLNNGAMELCRAMEYPLDTAEGALTIGYEDNIMLDVTYSDGTGASVDGISLEDITQTETQGWRVNLLQGREFVITGQEVPLMMFSSGSIGMNWDAYYSPSNYADSDVSYVVVTVRFVGGNNQPKGQIAYDDSVIDSSNLNFDFNAPDGSDSVYVRLYRLSGGAWSEVGGFVRQYGQSQSGTLECSIDYEALTLDYGVRMDGDSEYNPSRFNLETLLDRSWGCTWLTEPYVAQVREEILLVMFNGAAGDGGSNSLTYFTRPQDIPANGGDYVCLTVTFLAPDDILDPIQTAPPSAQSAELVGFASSYGDGDSYEDVASAWVHDYAENLVIGLPESDPAACSGVSIEGYSAVAASMTQPERIIVDVSLWCAPRNRAAFLDFYGQVLYGMPLAGQSSEPATEECDIILSRYLILELDNGVAECVSASSERPDLWGYLSLFSADSYESFLAGLDSSGDGAKQTVARANYSELDELSSESWMALLEALDSVAIDENGDGDQLIRDLYAMHAAVNSDGAYAEWLGGILSEQREHDEASFTLALESFSAEEQQVILTLAAPLT